jgi:hypothetical protein
MLSLGGGKQRGQDNEPDALGELIGQLLLLGFRAVCLSLDAFLHEGFGTDYLRAGPVAVPFGLWFSGQFPADDPRPLDVFLIAYAALWANAAIQAVRRWWRGEPRQHSLYTGRPFVMALFPRARESMVKVVEPAVFGAIAWATRGLNLALGDYLLLAAGLAFARAAVQEAAQHKQATQLHDMAAEEMAVAERFRDLRRPGR